MGKSYRKRVADVMLSDALEGAGAVLIEGPKWCGKTTTAEQIAKSSLYMNDPERQEQNLQLAVTAPSVLLNGNTPRLIDEWQMAPSLWDAVRFTVDRRKDVGQFILTGSAVPADTSKIYHSGAGRFAWIKMRTMSLWESGVSNGEVSLGDLFSGQSFVAKNANPLDLNKMASLICRGGWPGALGVSEKTALKIPYNYVDAICKTDISKVDGVRRDEQFTERLLRSISRHQGQQVAISTIFQDVVANEGESMKEETLASYISALKRLFVLEDMPAWNPNLRSKTAVRTTDTKYFTDPSIATASLRIGPQDLMNDLETFGLMFECLCVRDLRVYTEALDGNVFHYRDKNGLECDAVIHLRNGNYGLAEIKIGGQKWIDEAAMNLLKLADKIDTSKMPEPLFLMVITCVGDYAYRRKDGVYVVPISALKN